MRKMSKKILAFMLAAVMVFGAMAVGLPSVTNLFTAMAAEETEYKVGDIIEFGSYPQSEVTDKSLLAKLNSLELEWISYEYYSGDGDYGSMVSSDYMKYADVEYDSKKYRAVIFSSYRPSSTFGSNSGTSVDTNQDDNGYYTETIYWFEFEPIKWRILDPDECIVLSETIIDSQAFSNKIYKKSGYYNDSACTVYANDYETSSIREWLNNSFYYTAFNSIEQTNIQTRELDNGRAAYDSMYGGGTTYDKVFCLSYSEVFNGDYGFSTSQSSEDWKKRTQGSDYAKCQGLFTYSYSNWWLRTSGSYNSNNACYVNTYGYVGKTGYNVHLTNYGVRPALKLNKLPPMQTSKIAIFSTERSFCVKTGKSMWLGFGLSKNGKIDDEWTEMAVTVSDSSVVSLSNYEKTEYGYSLKIIGKKSGATNVTVTDTKSGVTTNFVVTVKDSYVSSCSYAIDNIKPFYPNNNWENDIATNIYNMNGIYVNNYECSKNGGGYKVSFDAYNSKYHTGAVDIFDANGNWIGSEAIEKYTSMTNVYNTLYQTYYLVSDLVTGKLLTYEQASFAKHSSIEIEVPEGGYFTISNNVAESFGAYLYNACEILYDGVSSIIDLATANSIDAHAFSELIADEVKKNPATRELFKEIFVKSVDKEIRNYTQNILEENIDDAYSNISNLLENMLDSLNISWKHAFKSVTGVAESVFSKLTGPAGLLLEGGYAFIEGTSKLLMAKDFASSVDETYATVYSSIDEGYINPHGVIVNTNGNMDKEAVLQVFKVSNNNTVEVILNGDDPLEKYEMYNICFIKNDELVQPDGKVTVYIPIPEGMQGDTCNVYRQESDNSWTVLKAHIEGNYLVFETDHFSLYAIVGDMASLDIHQKPNKQAYDSGSTLDTAGLTLSLNGKLITEGFICSPTVLSGSGMKKITVKYGYTYTEFYVDVKNSSTVAIITPSTNTIKYGDSIILHAEFTGELPAGATVQWSTDNGNFEKVAANDGMTCKITPKSSGETTITMKVVSADGEVIAEDTQKMTSKAGFFDKLIAFFKKLFGLTKTIPQAFKRIF